ncbi:MAG: hypothetical protein K2H64_11040 [Desulfovibrio sp.]|nr:hypothetical protein [Desulfovibrio sp.]
MKIDFQNRFDGRLAGRNSGGVYEPCIWPAARRSRIDFREEMSGSLATGSKLAFVMILAIARVFQILVANDYFHALTDPSGYGLTI